MSLAGSIRRRLLGIPPSRVDFDRLGFADCDSDVRRRLEVVMKTFATGYGMALESPDAATAVRRLKDYFDPHHLGFAFEGAGMCWALYDLALPWGGGRLRRAIEGPAEDHDFIATVGAGFAAARLPWGEKTLPDYLERLDPMIAWCVPDGYGFHQGLFRRREYVDEQRPAPRSWPAYARRLFDSGVGRSLWWSEGASPRRIARVVGTFPASRRAEMWCGLGVACAYACTGDEVTARELVKVSDGCGADVVSGAFFAARMRQRGGNPSEETNRVCRVWFGRDAGHVAEVARETAEHVRRTLPEAHLRSCCYGELRDRLLALVARPIDMDSTPSHPDSIPRPAKSEGPNAGVHHVRSPRL